MERNALEELLIDSSFSSSESSVSFVQEPASAWQMLRNAMVIALGNLFTVFINLFSMHFAGLESIDNLAAMSIALTWFNIVWYSFLVGSCNAFMALASHAYGAREYRKFGFLYQKALAFNWILATLAFLVFQFATEEFIEMLDEEELEDKVWKFIRWVTISNFLAGYYETTRYYLMANHDRSLFPKIAFPLLPLNYFLNYVLSKAGFELEGIVLSKIITEAILVCLLRRRILQSGNFEETYFSWTRNCLGNWKEELKVISPSILLVYMDYAAVQFMTVLSSQISRIDISVMTAILRVNSILFNIGYGLSIVIKNQIGNALGACDKTQARYILKTGILTFCALYGFLELLTFIFFGHITSFFSNSPEFNDTFSQCKLLFLLFLFLDPAQTTLNAIFRAFNLQKFGTFWYIITYFFFGIPIAALLGVVLWKHVAGLIAGLSLGCLAYLLIGAIKLSRLDYSERINVIRKGLVDVVH